MRISMRHTKPSAKRLQIWPACATGQRDATRFSAALSPGPGKAGNTVRSSQQRMKYTGGALGVVHHSLDAVAATVPARSCLPSQHDRFSACRRGKLLHGGIPLVLSARLGQFKATLSPHVFAPVIPASRQYRATHEHPTIACFLHPWSSVSAVLLTTATGKRGRWSKRARTASLD